MGSNGVSLLELTNAYAVFAAQGQYAEPIFIRRVMDRNGAEIERNEPVPPPRPLPPEWTPILLQARKALEAEKKQAEEEAPKLEARDLEGKIVRMENTGPAEPALPPLPEWPAPYDTGLGISPQLAYLMTLQLQGVVQNGTGWKAKALKRPIAGKTGTTDYMRDAWFVGFTPSLVTGVWIGYDDIATTLGRQEAGGRAACPIFVYFMERALLNAPIEEFTAPKGIVFKEIDGRYGTLAGPQTEEPYTEAFGEGLEPTDSPPPVDPGVRIRENKALGY